MALKREYLNVPNYSISLSDKGTTSKDWFKYLGDVGEASKTLEDDLNTSVDSLTTTINTEITNLHTEITNELSPNLTIVGDVKMSMSPSDHDTWLILDGRTLSRTTYATLWAFAVSNSLTGATAANFGTGDGSTTFTLPNPSGRSPVAAGAGSGLTARTAQTIGGEENHTLSISEMPAHDHTYGYSNAQGIAGSFAFAGAGNPTLANTSSTTGSTGGGSSHNNMQPWFGINFFIKYI